MSDAVCIGSQIPQWLPLIPVGKPDPFTFSHLLSIYLILSQDSFLPGTYTFLFPIFKYRALSKTGFGTKS